MLAKKGEEGKKRCPAGEAPSMPSWMLGKRTNREEKQRSEAVMKTQKKTPCWIKPEKKRRGERMDMRMEKMKGKNKLREDNTEKKIGITGPHEKPRKNDSLAFFMVPLGKKKEKRVREGE